MRHKKLRTRLGLNHSHRTSLLRNLSLSLIKHGKIKTTLSRTKALKRFFDKMVTKINKRTEDFNKIRIAKSCLGIDLPETRKIAFWKPISKSGLLSTQRIGSRRGDGAEMVQIVWREN